MNTRIVYTNPQTNKLLFITIPLDFFNKDSKARKFAESQGYIFSNDNEVIQWVANTYVPKGLEYHFVDSSKFPQTEKNRSNWYYDKDTNSVKDR